jgi:glycerol-3-phosphate dehydrogenase
MDIIELLQAEVERNAAAVVPPHCAERLAWNHGTQYRKVLEVARKNETWAGPLGSSRVLQAEVIYAIREEMAQTLADCVFQRTELGTAGNPGLEAIEQAARIAAGELGWDGECTAAEVAAVLARFPGTSGRGFGANSGPARSRR